jgi:hypothetical protein
MLRHQSHSGPGSGRPEPEHWFIMLLTAGMIGFVKRQKKF